MLILHALLIGAELRDSCGSTGDQGWNRAESEVHGAEINNKFNTPIKK